MASIFSACNPVSIHASLSFPCSLSPTGNAWTSVTCCLHCSQLESARSHLHLPLRPRTLLPTVITLRRIPSADSMKTPHNESSYSDLDWQERTSVFHHALRKINQSSHSRVPFPPSGSVSKHTPVATVILMVNTTDQVNGTDIYFFYFPPDSDPCHRLRTGSIHYASA